MLQVLFCETTLAKMYSDDFEMCIGDESFDDGTEAIVLYFEVK